MREYKTNHRGHRVKVNSMRKIFEAQTLTYMKAMKIRVRLLINFNVERLKEGIKRLVL